MSDVSSNSINTSLQSSTNAFNWVERYIKPTMFATPDSVLIGFLNSPIESSTGIGTDVPLLGMCETFSISQANTVVTLKELRCESTIVFPSKSQPGSISLTRMLGLGPNFMRAVGNYTDNKWRMNMQNVDSKQIFGLIIVFMSSDRTETLSTLFAERCVIQSCSTNIQAGQVSLFENVNILFDKIIDDCDASTITTTGTPSTTDTTTDTTTNTTSNTTSNTINNMFSAINKANQTINKVKAANTALKSIHSIGTVSTAVSYVENLIKTL